MQTWEPKQEIKLTYQEVQELRRKLSSAGYDALKYLHENYRLDYSSSLARKMTIEDFKILLELGCCDNGDCMYSDESYKPRYKYPYFT